MATLEHAKQAADRANLSAKKGVVGVGYGLKRVRGQLTQTPCVVVFVEKKLPLSALTAQQAIPFEVEGVPTDVVEVRTVDALIFHGVNTVRKRPCPGGYSVGHPQITAGTLGLPVVMKDGKSYILSNAHVMSPENGSVKIADPIYQPGPLDGGREEDKIATLDSWVPIDFSGKPNQVDAAIAENIPGLVDWRIEALGAVYERAGDPQPDREVVKAGRTTGLTKGKIAVVGAVVRVNYGDSRIALFTDQLEIVSTEGEPFSRPGDSGSAILSRDGKEVLGLLFAGDDTSTYANPISLVSQALGFVIVPRPGPETIERQLEGLRESLVIVWRWEAREKRWLFYDPRAAEVSTLFLLEKGKGYWIQVARDVSFSYHGFTYELVAGWNQLGFVGRAFLSYCIIGLLSL